jgi:uncharacterized protein (DUF2141 family)
VNYRSGILTTLAAPKKNREDFRGSHREFMTVTKLFLLGMVSAVVPPNVGGTLPKAVSQTSYANTWPLRPADLAQTQPLSANLIHVEIGGLRNNKGQIVCDLHSSADGFPKNSDKALAHAKSAISNGHAVCEFPDVKAGTYAVSVFHDENSNGKLDTNFMGIPREGVGASNNAKGHFGPPKFDAAAFRFSGGLLELKITITYL